LGGRISGISVENQLLTAITLTSLEQIPLSLYSPGGLALVLWFAGCNADCTWCPWAVNVGPRAVRELRVSHDEIVDLVHRNKPELVFMHGAPSIENSQLLNLAKTLAKIVPVGLKIRADALLRKHDVPNILFSVILVEIVDEHEFSSELMQSVESMAKGNVHVEILLVLRPDEHAIKTLLLRMKELCGSKPLPLAINIVAHHEVNEFALVQYVDLIRKAGCSSTTFPESSVSELASVLCPYCKHPVIIRQNARIIKLMIDSYGRCRYCNNRIVSRMPRILHKTPVNIPLM